MKSAKVYKPLLFVVLTLAVLGYVIFWSASFGLLAKSESQFGSVAFGQTVGLAIGLVFLWFFSKIKYQLWKKIALIVFIGAILFNAILFFPEMGMTHGGATRWIDVGFLTIQPSELLKIAFIIFLASWLSGKRNRAESLTKGILVYMILVAVVGFLILSQNDTETLIIIAATGMAMLLSAGAKWKHILLMIILGCVVVGGVVYLKPYAMKRIEVFLNPSLDPQGAGYQVQQLLVTVGSGKITGRGFGESIQKYNYLPEPIGDSIFAVAAEEFGFIGASVLVALYLLLGLLGLRTAARAPDEFGRLLACGIAILIVTESFGNIASMTGVLPLAGVPLLFVSHGGTALMIVLAEAGILLNISRFSFK